MCPNLTHCAHIYITFYFSQDLGWEKPRLYEGFAGTSKEGHTKEDPGAISPCGASTNAGSTVRTKSRLPQGWGHSQLCLCQSLMLSFAFEI